MVRLGSRRGVEEGLQRDSADVARVTGLRQSKRLAKDLGFGQADSGPSGGLLGFRGLGIKV